LESGSVNVLEHLIQIQVSLAISFVCDDVLCLYGISQITQLETTVIEKCDEKRVREIIKDEL
jgi:hypothetical protein